MTTDDATGLAACPFCGGPAEWKPLHCGAQVISCADPSCIADGIYASTAEVWNRRAVPPAPRVCRKPMRGLYGVPSTCGRPERHTGACDSVWDYRDWPAPPAPAAGDEELVRRIDALLRDPAGHFDPSCIVADVLAAARARLAQPPAEKEKL